MGSSSKPAKQSDRPIIVTPRTKGGGTGGGSGQKTFDLNQTCPVYFDVKLANSPLLRTGTALSMNDRGKILFNKSEVGTLTAQQFRKVVECLEHGYVYLGRVAVDKKKNLYGRFERTTA